MNARVEMIRDWARRLANLHPTGFDVSLFAIMAGALYALEKADGLDYQDGRGLMPDAATLTDEFRMTLEMLGKGEDPPQTWRAGFWFMSALVRLSPLLKRLNLPYDDKVPSPRTNVQQDVNWFKHNEAQHPATPMVTTWDDALAVAKDVYDALESRVK